MAAHSLGSKRRKYDCPKRIFSGINLLDGLDVRGGGINLLDGLDVRGGCIYVLDGLDVRGGCIYVLDGLDIRGSGNVLLDGLHALVVAAQRQLAVVAEVALAPVGAEGGFGVSVAALAELAHLA